MLSHVKDAWVWLNLHPYLKWLVIVFFLWLLGVLWAYIYTRGGKDFRVGGIELCIGHDRMNLWYNMTDGRLPYTPMWGIVIALRWGMVYQPVRKIGQDPGSCWRTGEYWFRIKCPMTFPFISIRFDTFRKGVKNRPGINVNDKSLVNDNRMYAGAKFADYDPDYYSYMKPEDHDKWRPGKAILVLSIRG